MKHVIIGTAGHVDHGKTALVKALTGIDTDRLEEEKRRGVTIEPGFAYLDFDDGSRAGIIDVPGHERFIRNMLAGAGGIDLAMLVVAADEGVMPQTREHLGILTQLGIGDGLVVLTKTDKIEPDWLELVKEDVLELVQGTFLEKKQLIPVSAQTGDGISDLKNALNELAVKTKEKDTGLPFRLPVDRVFPVDGFGTVVTGTLIEGSVNLGDTAEILPSREKAPIRNLQVHGDNVETAFAGQRTAISLAGVKRGNIKRGDVLSAEGKINTSAVLDVKLGMLPDTKRIVKNNSELHLYHGAGSTLTKVFLLDKKEVSGGESCYARFKLKEPLPCKRGDRFVVRFYSPVETIGGGMILDSSPKSRISKSEAAFAALKIREQGSAAEIAGLAAYELGGVFTDTDLTRRTDISSNECKEIIKDLIADGSIKQLTQDKYISTKVLTKLFIECKEILTLYHKANPLRAGMNIAELRQKLIPDVDTPEANAVLKALKENEVIKVVGNVVALPGFAVEYTQSQSKIHKKLSDEITKAGYEVKTPDELLSLFGKNEKRDFEQVFECMVSGGELIMLTAQIYWQKGVYANAVALIQKHFENNTEITLAQCRDILGTSRKYALAFLEHLDSRQVTKLYGDVRRITKGFEVI